jgi:hypothetical protein
VEQIDKQRGIREIVFHNQGTDLCSGHRDPNPASRAKANAQLSPAKIPPRQTAKLLLLLLGNKLPFRSQGAYPLLYALEAKTARREYSAITARNLRNT